MGRLFMSPHFFREPKTILNTKFINEKAKTSYLYHPLVLLFRGTWLSRIIYPILELLNTRKTNTGCDVCVCNVVFLLFFSMVGKACSY